MRRPGRAAAWSAGLLLLLLASAAHAAWHVPGSGYGRARAAAVFPPAGCVPGSASWTANADTYVARINAASNFDSDGRLQVRLRTNQALSEIALVRFPWSIPQGCTAAGAALTMTTNADPQVAQSIGVLALCGPWEETSVTWNTHPGDCSGGAAIASAVTPSTANAAVTWTIPPSALTPYGLDLRAAGNAGRSVFWDRETGSAARQPRLTVTWA